MATATKFSTLVVERSGDGVSWIKLNRPKVFNAVTMQMLSELINAVKELDSDKTVKAHPPNLNSCFLSFVCQCSIVLKCNGAVCSQL
jgi:hypothetical protein